MHKPDLYLAPGDPQLTRNQLISAPELYENLHDAAWCAVDCRSELMDRSAGRRAYAAAHIPGAVFIDLDDDLASPVGQTTGRHPLPDVTLLTATLGRLGIGNNTTVVVYDSGDGALAARAWWVLRWLGHTDVRVLDGGLAAWTDFRFPQSSDVVVARPAKFVCNVQDGLVITTAEICNAGANAASLKLFDARSAERFAGEEEPIDIVAGHIPGARSLPYPVSMNDDGRWKSIEALQALWQQHLGDDRLTEWVAMCGSGVTACHLALSAVEAGYREPRLYVGSWSEWITDSSRPIDRGYG